MKIFDRIREHFGSSMHQPVEVAEFPVDVKTNISDFPILSVQELIDSRIDFTSPVIKPADMGLGSRITLQFISSDPPFFVEIFVEKFVPFSPKSLDMGYQDADITENDGILYSEDFNEGIGNFRYGEVFRVQNFLDKHINGKFSQARIVSAMNRLKSQQHENSDFLEEANTIWKSRNPGVTSLGDGEVYRA